MKKIIILVAVLFSLTVYSIALTQAYPILDIDVGAKSTSMSGAFTAISDDPSAVFANPAGLSNVKQLTISGVYNKWVLDASFQYLGLAAPVGPGTMAGGFIYSDMGAFVKRDAFGALLNSEIKPYSVGGGVSYGMQLYDFLSAGAGLKIVNQSVGDTSDTAFMIDLGVILKYGIISAGLVMQNAEMAPEFFGVKQFKAGIAADVLNVPGHHVICSVDTKYTGLFDQEFCAAVDYTIAERVSIRGGYKFGAENNILGGASGLNAGLALNIQGLKFEYAFSSGGDLGINHTAGVSYVFEDAEEKENKNYQKLTQFLAYQYFRDGQDLYEKGSYAEAYNKFEQAGAMSPDYPGLVEAKTKAQRMQASGGQGKKAAAIFEAGMEAYEKGDYAEALDKWENVKKIDPYYKEVDIWIKDAKDMKVNKPETKEGGKYLSEGLKYYNNCDYSKAIESWSMGADAGGGKMLQQYIDRAKAKKKEMTDGLAKAKADVAKETTVVEGIKKLRIMAGTCPSYGEATSALAALKQVIDMKSREYYYKGIDSYTSGNLDAAIIYWRGIEDLDPKSEYITQVNRYIEDARKKRKALEKMGKEK